MGTVTARVLFALATICFSLHHVTCNCNFDVIRSLGVLRGDQDDSGILDMLAKEGSYQLAFVTIGKLTPLLNPHQCLKATFAKTKKGYQVHYNGVGTYGLGFNSTDNSIDVFGNDGQTVNKYYVIFKSESVVALYSCDPSNTSGYLFIGSVYVASSSVAGSQPLVAQAIKALSDVGVKNGVAVAPC